jgi:hypothetical protein
MGKLTFYRFIRVQGLKVEDIASLLAAEMVR